MKRGFILGLAATAMALAISVTIPATVKAASKYPVKYTTDEEWECLKLTNKERVKAGVAPLSTYSTLQKVADIRSNELRTLWGHTRPDGTDYYTAYLELGLDDCLGPENIATSATPEMVIKMWMDSPGHRATMLSEGEGHVGISHEYGWVQDYGYCINGITKVSVKDAKKVSSFKRGTSIDDMNKLLVLKCDCGTSYIPIIKEMCKGYKPNEAGIQTIKVKYGSKTLSFKVSIKGESIKKASVKGLKTKVYSGKSITQSPKVVLNGKTLKKNKDYTISYKNNKNAGTATITIQGKGKYSGTIKKTFKIKKQSFKKVKISSIPTQEYTGKPIMPKFKVTYNGKTVNRKYYSVIYSNNVKEGKATMTITGRGNFKGTVKKNFRIQFTVTTEE